MAFTSLQKVFTSLDNQGAWKARQQFQQLLDCWATVVGQAVAAQTRPLSLRRQVLYVATSSSAWAQNLAFERHRILQKLNPLLEVVIIDIRFSTVQWYSDHQQKSVITETSQTWQTHPSQISVHKLNPASLVFAQPSDPQTAFQAWVRVIKQQAQKLPLCPQCQCPTPSGELERWSVCGHCAAQGWANIKINKL
jgi:predicted nucleic acid-binding Zn ribbon protein